MNAGWQGRWSKSTVRTSRPGQPHQSALQAPRAAGRILIPPALDAARRKGTQRLRCSMGRCSRGGSLKAAFRWWYQDTPRAASLESLKLKTYCNQVKCLPPKREAFHKRGGFCSGRSEYQKRLTSSETFDGLRPRLASLFLLGKGRVVLMRLDHS